MLPLGIDFYIHTPLGGHQRIYPGDSITGMEVIFTDDVKYPVTAMRVQRNGTIIYY